MRQIDADTAILIIQKDKIEGETLDIIKALGDGLQAETLNQACDRHIKIINSLPTIEAEPVRHGRWINTTETVGWPKWNCSVCGGGGRGDYKFCPYCGARMDGEKND